MFKILFFLLLFQSAFANLNFRSELFGSVSNREENKNSRFNSNNRVLEIPRTSAVTEWRPDFDYEINSNHSVILRSQHFVQYYQYNFRNPDQEKSETLSESDLSDFFVSSRWSDQIQTTLGLQNYQWGPAEIFSPTNPFFHFLNDQRSFFFKEKGRILVRINWTPNPETAQWSVIGITEPDDNRTRHWTADREFEPKSLLLLDYKFDNPANQLAFVIGTGEEQKEFIGEYFTWSFQEGHSLYGDIKHQKGRTNFVPQTNNLGFIDLVESSETQKILTTAVLGYRYEGRVDLRQEFIFNEPGFSPDEWRQAKTSALTISPNVLTNAKRLAKPGLEFLTQLYSYTSLRVPDLGPRDQSSLSLRYLSSLQHNTSVLQINIEHNLNDHTVLTAESLHYMGSSTHEFRISEDQQTSIGFRYSF